MQRFFKLLFLWAFLLSACTVVPASPPPVSPTVTETSIAIPTTAVPDPGSCGYQWAYQDLPELSSSFQQSIQALQPEAQATVFAFGENCIGNDGSVVRFIPMETDFNITLQVVDLTNESDLGEWIVKVMQVISAIPSDQIVGPRPGRVGLFFQSGAEQKAVNFYINQYQGLSQGLSNAEIFQALQVPQ